ncbi:dimethylaniline monooxygenase (N-oxide forming) [Aureobasidium pullulans]|nr:dimethylaniline monooxygenase (N-oxide forming) [Aureobasidium pullulans]
MQDTYDLVVIGAGWYGLAVAATYLQVNPDATILVLEAQSTVGGVWSEERQYPDLKSNNMLGTYEYPDFPMDKETYGVKPGEHIPGHVIHRYLGDYAEKTGVYARIRFETKVLEASRNSNGEGWILTTDSSDLATLSARKLVVATGLTSEPFIPSFTGAEVFTKSNGLLIHSRNFNKHTSQLFDKSTSVTVLGGSKSAWDVAYACASRDVPVNLVIRSSGQGPTWMAPPYVTPFKAWLEKLVHRRFLTWLSPCIWGDEDGFSTVRKFLHTSWLGRKAVDAFWWVLSSDANALMGWDRHPETMKLKPRYSAFWTGSGLGILNFESDFLGLVREGKVKVFLADVDELGEGIVRLSDGTELIADAVVCATGWKARPPIKFSPEGMDAELGLPSDATQMFSQKDIAAADAEILSRFPKLREQPKTPVPGGDTSADDTTQPFTLYRFMAPPKHMLEGNNIAFAGMMTTISTPLCAYLQALWITAYLSNTLSRLPSSTLEAEKTALLHSRFGRWRYACGYGARFPDFVFDAVPYLDMLLRDLGIREKRKGGWLGEIFEAYGPEDYKGVVDEWSEMQKKKQ